MNNNITLKVTDTNYEDTFSGSDLREIIKEIVCGIYDVKELMTFYYNATDIEEFSENDFIDDLEFYIKHQGYAKICNDEMTITLD